MFNCSIFKMMCSLLLPSTLKVRNHTHLQHLEAFHLQSAIKNIQNFYFNTLEYKSTICIKILHCTTQSRQNSLISTKMHVFAKGYIKNELEALLSTIQL